MALSNSSRTSYKTSIVSWSKSQHTTQWASQAKKSYPKKSNLSPPPSKTSTSPPPLRTSSPPCLPNFSSTSKTAATRTFTRASSSSSSAAGTSSCAASRAPLLLSATSSPSKCLPPCRSCERTWQRCWRLRGAIRRLRLGVRRRLGRVAVVPVIFPRGLRQPFRVGKLAASEGRELVQKKKKKKEKRTCSFSEKRGSTGSAHLDIEKLL